MKILVYGLNYAPEQTGSGKFTGEMASWFAGRGHQVEVICGLPHYPAWEIFDEYRGTRFAREFRDGVAIMRVSHHVPSRERARGLARILMEVTFSVAAARYWVPKLLAWEPMDAIIAVAPPTQIAAWPLWYHWLRGRPFILHLQDLQVDAALRLGLISAGRGVAHALYGLESWLLKRATRVSTITAAMRSRVIAKGAKPENVLLVPNWGDLENIRPGPRCNSFRKALGLSHRTIVALYAGNVGQKQGLEVVVDAAKILRDESDIYFLVVGDGAARPALENYAKVSGIENLRFLAPQPEDRLGEMLAAGDVHLVVQKREAADLVMPSKLANICAAGRVSVATADVGTALGDTIRENGLGVITSPGDALALASAVQRLARDHACREAFGTRARAFAEAYLSQDRILSDLERQLRALCMEDDT